MDELDDRLNNRPNNGVFNFAVDDDKFDIEADSFTFVDDDDDDELNFADLFKFDDDGKFNFEDLFEFDNDDSKIIVGF